VIKNTIKKFFPDFLQSFYYWLFPFFGAFFYGFPSRKLKVIGVTGTNGKSSVVFLTAKILEEAGFKTASLSSIEFKIGEKAWRNTLKMTMPGRFIIQKFLRQAVKAGCQYAVLEVTSEGIKQHRHQFINFDVAIFTNLTPEHIESHGSFEKYREAKGKLFSACRNIHIINADDPNADYFLQFPAQQKLLYSPKKEKTFVLNSTKVLGEFNIDNALAATWAGLSQGVDLEICRRAVVGIETIPGRMEQVIKEPFSVIVDYAHTPDALQKVYETLSERNPKPEIPNPKQTQNPNNKNSKLICVLGACGGGRDKWKRPKLGEIAVKYCNQIILTNEDPYDEDPDQIIKNIKQGALQAMPRHNLYTVLDRREAIRKALSLAVVGDTVIITGKGSEPWICVAGGKKIPWDDRKVVREEFKKLNDVNNKRKPGL
jgi:UDP-N-acetylmuramoyl-L-alanyl-D-glutamate--2,6-diaminopimelate ligase